MKSFVIFALLFIAVSAERYIPNSADPEHPGHCYHKELKLAIKKGEYVKPTNIGECFELGCQDEGVIRVNECPRLPAPMSCTFFKADYTKKYPDCCPYAKC